MQLLQRSLTGFLKYPLVFATLYSKTKPQRVALLFEDEGDDDEDKGSLFGIKHAANTNAATPAKVSALMIRFGGFFVFNICFDASLQ